MQHVDDTIDNREILQRFLPPMPEEEEEEEEPNLVQSQENESSNKEDCVNEALNNTIIETAED